MGRKTIDRTGERGINNFGSQMVIVEYRNKNDIDIYFPEYNWGFKGATYQSFKNGQIKCPYERRYYNIGYLGEGSYKASENGKHTRVYSAWKSMLQRCYDDKYHQKQPTYIDCEVNNEWHNFQNFAKWYYENYYKIEGERMHLDKDILVKCNKIYSPDTCIFVPEKINILFIKCNKSRGSSPIGVSFYKGKYTAHCQIFDPETGKSKQKTLGYYNTEQEAFNVYKQFKEKNIKLVADYYKNLIPERLYKALYNYEVEITD